MATVVDREILNSPPRKHWIGYIKQRISQNKNFLGFISGPTGSGKTYSCLRIAEELDPDFGIDRVVFKGTALMDLINSGKLKKGSVIVFEEIGVEMSNKNWASVTNKMLNYLMQTFRHRNFILLMNSPYMDFVDASTRKLFHAEMRTIKIDFKLNQVVLKPLVIQYNSRLQKFYYKRLKVITAHGKLPLNLWSVDKPSKDLLDKYDIKKNSFTDELNKKILAELRALDGPKLNPLSDNQELVIKMLKDGKLPQEIADIRNRHVSGVEYAMQQIKKKGWKLTPVFGHGSTRAIRYDVEELTGDTNSA